MLHKRALTINFARSVGADGPSVMEVAVAPLAAPSAPGQNATLVGGVQTRTVLLTATTTPVVFDLVPTDHPGLAERVPYRVSWRDRHLGRQHTEDIVMPDFDVDFDNLADLGNIIGGQTYVQWTDRGRRDGVAALDHNGRVVDADGDPVTGDGAALAVQVALTAESAHRAQADADLRAELTEVADTKAGQARTAALTALAVEANQRTNADLVERTARLAAVNNLTGVLGDLRDAVTPRLDQHDAVLTAKADLVGGKIPAAQIPNLAFNTSVVVSSQVAMLALTSTQVQPGDLAIITDGPKKGTYILTADDPSALSNWTELVNPDAPVASVNGKIGTVVLAAADVGARGSADPVPQNDVTGLTAALSAKTADIAALTARVHTLETDPTTVKTTGGLIPKPVMPAESAFISNNRVVNKSGGIVAGGPVSISDVAGLNDALVARVTVTDPRLADARTPTAHAASHRAGGSDPVTPADIGARAAATPVPLNDVDGLAAALAAKATLTVQQQQGGQITGLTTRVDTLESTRVGPTGPAGILGPAAFFAGAAPTTNLAGVVLRSPFGYDTVNARYYYDPAGADASQAVWPYLTPNGHLKFVARNEAAAPDPELAKQSDLTALTATVAGKADTSALINLTTTVTAKADAATVTALTTTVGTKANQSALDALTTTVTAKADASAVTALTTTVGTKASQSALDALTTTVGTKASQSALDALTTAVTAKADLDQVDGMVPLAQIRNLPTSKVIGLDAALTAKADLTAGKIPVAQVPDITTSKVTGLDAALTAKADLVGGKVNPAQLPELTMGQAYPVNNQTEMLGLSTAAAGSFAVRPDGIWYLNALPASTLTNWVKFQFGASVSSVNGQTGTVTLAAADVGARPSGDQIPLNDVNGLAAALAAKATVTEVATKVTADQAKTTARTVASDTNKAVVRLVAATAGDNLGSFPFAGTKTIDGVAAAAGDRVLVTNQSTAYNNGIYKVAAGQWTREPDMAAGSVFLRGALAVVTAGTTAANSVWQQTAPSGTTADNLGGGDNTWQKILTAGVPPKYTATADGGLQRDPSGADYTFRVVPKTDGGISVGVGGVAVDRARVPMKFVKANPGNTATVTVNHNLGTQDVVVGVRRTLTGDAVLVGWRVPPGSNAANQIILDFDSGATAAACTVVVIG